MFHLRPLGGLLRELTLISYSWYNLLLAAFVFSTGESDGQRRLKMKKPASWIFLRLVLIKWVRRNTTLDKRFVRLGAQRIWGFTNLCLDPNWGRLLKCMRSTGNSTDPMCGRWQSRWRVLCPFCCWTGCWTDSWWQGTGLSPAASHRRRGAPARRTSPASRHYRSLKSSSPCRGRETKRRDVRTKERREILEVWFYETWQKSRFH